MWDGKPHARVTARSSDHAAVFAPVNTKHALATCLILSQIDPGG